jgi:hypothetical protein
MNSDTPRGGIATLKSQPPITQTPPTESAPTPASYPPNPRPFPPSGYPPVQLREPHGSHAAG